MTRYYIKICHQLIEIQLAQSSLLGVTVCVKCSTYREWRTSLFTLKIRTLCALSLMDCLHAVDSGLDWKCILIHAPSHTYYSFQSTVCLQIINWQADGWRPCENSICIFRVVPKTKRFLKVSSWKSDNSKDNKVISLGTTPQSVKFHSFSHSQ